MDGDGTKFGDNLRKALALVRSGELGSATRAIQQALGGAARAEEPIEARVVPRAERVLPPPPAAKRARPRATPSFRARSVAPLERRLVVPPAAEGARPLLVMLHGCKQDAEDFARGTRMDAEATARGWYVVYPEQSMRANGSRCWNWFDPRHQAPGQGETAALLGTIDDIAAAHPIDPSRVYVAGLSAGAAMAVLLAANHPERIAAVASHSGLPYGAASNVSAAFAAMREGGRAPALPRSPRYVPLLALHGDADSTVSPANTERLVAQWHAWGANDEWTHATDGDNGAAGTRCERWTDADGRPMLEHWRVRGAGHAWSGGDPQGSYTDPNGPDASALMLRFFATHALG